MTRSYYIYNTIRYLIDAPILFISFWIAKYFFPNTEIYSDESYGFVFILFSIIAWYSAAQVSRLYTDRRTKKYSEEIIYITFTILLFAILLTSFLFFLRNNFQFSNYFFVIYFATLFFLITFTKYILRKYLHSVIYRGKLYEQILLIGSTPAAKDFYDTVNRYYYYGYKCIGFLDDEETKLNGCPYLGRIDNLKNILAEKAVDEIIIALPNSKHEQIQNCIEVCDFHAKRVRIIPDLYLYASSNIQVNNIGLLPIINLRSLPQDLWANKVLKRIFDIGFSILFFLIIGWWLLPLIALAIKLTSKGPVFFKQERWGLNNQKIICYKFRSMVDGSAETDAQGNYLQASPNDSRVTPLGRYLRKTNMDELPQFWNVLLGNMSVVGPRPHPTPLNLASIQLVDRYMLRHLVKPGITGWAQVNGYRGETKTPEAMQRRVNFDLYYIHSWTFWLDCQIILQTIINIFRGDQNAY
ncbi:undecaprenyl-phosphate glucose phosphotransferase [Rubrolithibacter danxiaensis]|uniref:undecaprenyl-phosphate glucose phosphotransferase n=1 Tax=Rubrolithibacter danxiaensis TaxID=3390805 RepID=UPI003BF8C048